MTFTDSDYGALQISAARKMVGDITDEELLSDAQQFAPPSAEITPVILPHFTGMRADYFVDGIVWRVWFLRAGRTLVFATYNADPTQCNLEINVIEMIVASLSPEEN